MGFFQDMGKNSSPLTSVSYAMAAPETDASKPWNSEDLLEMAKIYDLQADELQSEATRWNNEQFPLFKNLTWMPKGFTGLD